APTNVTFLRRTVSIPTARGHCPAARSALCLVSPRELESPLLAHRRLQALVQLREELLRGQPGLLRADQQREVLRHVARLDAVDADALQRLRELREVGVVVQLRAVCQPSSPREDRGDRVGGGLLALLVLPVV